MAVLQCLISNVFILQTMQPQTEQNVKPKRGTMKRKLVICNLPQCGREMAMAMGYTIYDTRYIGWDTHSKAKKRALVPVIRMHVK